jgi:hypothetical protein
MLEDRMRAIEGRLEKVQDITLKAKREIYENFKHT